MVRKTVMGSMMTFKILKSQLGGVGADKFRAAVSAFAKEKKQWIGHMERVRRDASKPFPERPNIATLPRNNNIMSEYTNRLAAYAEAVKDHHLPYKEPEADPVVMACVDSNGEPSYEIINDDPPLPTKAEKLEAKKNDLLAKVDAEERAAICAIAAVVPEAKRRYVEIRVRDLANIDQSDWSEDDKRIMAVASDMRAKQDAVVRAAAKMSFDIADLNAKNIDAWTFTPFEVGS